MEISLKNYYKEQCNYCIHKDDIKFCDYCSNLHHNCISTRSYFEGENEIENLYFNLLQDYSILLHNMGFTISK